MCNTRTDSKIHPPPGRVVDAKFEKSGESSSSSRGSRPGETRRRRGGRASRNGDTGRPGPPAAGKPNGAASEATRNSTSRRCQGNEEAGQPAEIAQGAAGRCRNRGNPGRALRGDTGGREGATWSASCSTAKRMRLRGDSMVHRRQPEDAGSGAT